MMWSMRVNTFDQVKLYGKDEASSKTWIGWEEEAIPEKRNYMNKISDKMEPITTYSGGKQAGKISMHVDHKW